jgi:hypothetical protein
MSRSEINGLFCWKNLNGLSRWAPCGLNLKDKLWWRFMPGVVINVKWPKGQIRVGPSHRLGWNGIGDYFEYVESADPNDFYRPWLEEHVGKQGWDWNWGMGNNDAAENRLTIKIRRKHEKYATMAALRWS